MECRKRRENWQVDTQLKPRDLDTVVTVVDKTGDSTLSHCKNKLSAGTQSVDRSDVPVHLYLTSVECVKDEWTRNDQYCR